MSVLSVNNVKKIYQADSAAPSAALNGISFEVEKGELVGIMGPSGAGKSTLLNVIATIDTPTSGHIKIGDQDICAFNSRLFRTFAVISSASFFGITTCLHTLTLRENIALQLILAKKKASEIDGVVSQLARQLGIEALLNKYPCEVSGGERQRTSAARTIINRPELLMADEPTGAPDSMSARDLMEGLQSLNETQKATILLVTHDAFAASFCQRILLIKDGRLYREICREGNRKAFMILSSPHFPSLGVTSVSFAEIALKNVRKRLGSYVAFFFSTSFSVIVFHLFCTMYFNPAFSVYRFGSGKMNTLFQGAAMGVLMFAAIFVLYSGSFFLRGRKKEIAIYSLLGMAKRTIAWLLFCETLAIGMAAVIFGIAVSSVAAPYFSSALMRVMAVGSAISYTVSPMAAVITAAAFAVLFTVSGIRAYKTIYRYRLIDLLSAARQSEGVPKYYVVGGSGCNRFFGGGVFGRMLHEFEPIRY